MMTDEQLREWLTKPHVIDLFWSEEDEAWIANIRDSSISAVAETQADALRELAVVMEALAEEAGIISRPTSRIGQLCYGR